jgi:hypothetical protein
MERQAEQSSVDGDDNNDNDTVEGSERQDEQGR